MDPVTAIGLVLSLLDRAAQIGALIQTARAEGRDITPDELDKLRALDDEARKSLVDAIERARAEGR